MSGFLNWRRWPTSSATPHWLTEKDLPPIDIALVEGAVASDEHFREILHIRRQARLVIALETAL